TPARAGLPLRLLPPLRAAARRADREAGGARRRVATRAVRRRRDRGSGAQRLSGGARGAFFRLVFPVAARVLFHRTLARRPMRIDAAPARGPVEQRRQIG